METASVIAAFSEDQAERLTGLTRRQLRYWDKTGVLSPSFVEIDDIGPSVRAYSFIDVLALKTLSALRKRVSLQHLREAGKRMKAMKIAAWTGTRLYIVNHKVIFQEPGSGKPREVVSGQYVFPIVLETVFTDTKEAVANLRRRPDEKIGQVEQNRNVGGNAWVVAGTRVHVLSIKRLSEDGYTTDQILAEYPHLTASDVEAALQHEATPAAA